jgi:hypothetical protein
MTLSMQISRGALAMALLLLFGLMALAGHPEARNRLGVVPGAANLSVCEVSVPRIPGWRLAQTPADLGPLARRLESCRA